MDEIEASVEMPKAAGPLSSYARYYTSTRDGQVVGSYTRKIEEREPGVVCSEMMLDGNLQDVACPALADAKIGERRWVSFEDFPAIGDEDCGAVQVVYDPRTHRMLDVRCVVPDY